MEQLIDPRTLARVKDMPLVAKTVAEGFLHGVQTSMQRGVGIEFSQYRSYENGDEISRIDWKLYARSDRYFVREAERESEIDVWFVLDASNSMLQRSNPKNLKPSKNSKQNWNKMDYAKHLIASMSYIAHKQGDSIGYLGLSSDALNFTPTGIGERQWLRLLQNVSATNSGNHFPDVKFIKHHLAQLQKPSIIFIVSDFNQKQQEISDFVSQLNSSLSEVVALQLVSDEEVEFNFKGAVRFKDLETEEEVLVSAKDAKSIYLENYKKYQQQMDELLAEQNCQLHRFNIDKPMDLVLFEYLRQRQRFQ